MDCICSPHTAPGCSPALVRMTHAKPGCISSFETVFKSTALIYVFSAARERVSHKRASSLLSTCHTLAPPGCRSADARFYDQAFVDKLPSEVEQVALDDSLFKRFFQWESDSVRVDGGEDIVPPVIESRHDVFASSCLLPSRSIFDAPSLSSTNTAASCTGQALRFQTFARVCRMNFDFH